MGQTIREVLSYKDPVKREKKRVKRAYNKAKRLAVTRFDTADLEPIPVGEVVNAARDDQQQWTATTFAHACAEAKDESGHSMLDFEPLPVKFNTDPVAERGLAQMIWTSPDLATLDMLDPVDRSTRNSISSQLPPQYLNPCKASDVMPAGAVPCEAQGRIFEGTKAPSHRLDLTYNHHQNHTDHTDFSPSCLMALNPNELQNDDILNMFGQRQT